MTLDDRLTALRDMIQHDVGQRGLARDPLHNLVNAFPGDFAAACRSIGEHPDPRVALVTGFWIADAGCGETDGPPGTVFLARALLELGIPARIVTDDWGVRAIGTGLRHHGVESAIPVSTTLAEAVSHLIAIERVGPASDGRCYSMRGRDVTAFMAPLHELFEATIRPITIGIGDGGNEIGMGKIPIETIERNIPDGRTIACRTATDFLIVAGISNWGAYALAAGVAIERGQRLSDELFDPASEFRSLQAMVDDGPLVDGRTGLIAATVDGVAWDDYASALKMIRGAAGQQL
jgi:hypothetical protein